jgi:hypothetical protein
VPCDLSCKIKKRRVGCPPTTVRGSRCCRASTSWFANWQSEGMQSVRTMVRLCTAAVILAGCWGVANLYEAVVMVPLLSGLPPGSLPAVLVPGSPVLFHVPVGGALIAVVAAAMVVALRGDLAAPARTRRRVAVGGVAFVTAVVVTVPVVLWVNPIFRDGAATNEDVATAAWVWEAANFLRMLCAAAVVATFSCSARVTEP